MENYATHWRRVVGSGLIYDGPCIVRQIIMWPGAAEGGVYIYDGRDTTSGKKFATLGAVTAVARHIGLGQGVLFGRGIYVDSLGTAEETTIVFIPLK